MKQEFVDWMDSKADAMVATAASNSIKHWEAKHIKDATQAYRTGKNGYDSTFIPCLGKYLEAYYKENDAEWKEFQRLAEKFGVKVV